jgi:hypothetical protein
MLVEDFDSPQEIQDHNDNHYYVREKKRKTPKKR